MEDIPGYSLYESMFSSMSIVCTFTIKDNYSDDLIKEKWINFKNNILIYMITQLIFVDKGNNYSNTPPLKYINECQTQYSLENCSTQLKNYLFGEIIKPESPYQNKSLLGYLKININNIEYTISVFILHILELILKNLSM